MPSVIYYCHYCGVETGYIDAKHYHDISGDPVCEDCAVTEGYETDPADEAPCARCGIDTRYSDGGLTLSGPICVPCAEHEANEDDDDNAYV
jgi:hypothetical protein